MTSRAIALLILLALSALATTGRAEPGDRKSIQLRGRITDERGTPLADATVTASGHAVLSAVANADGRYLLNLELGTVADLKLHPATWHLEAKSKGKRVPVAGGTERLEFTVFSDSSGHVLVSANLRALGTDLNRELSRDGNVVANVALDFTRARPGKSAPADSSKAASAVGPVAAATASSKGAAPSGAASAPVATAGSAATTARKTKAAPLTAAEILEASKQRGSIEATDVVRDSLRRAAKAAHRDEEWHATAVRDSAQRAQRAQEWHATAVRDSAQRAQRAQERYAAQVQDSVQRAQRAQKKLTGQVQGMMRDVEAEAAKREQAARNDSLRAAQRTRDSLDTVAHAQQEAREDAMRDSVRAAQRAKNAQREVLRIEEIQHMIFRRDSSVTALRTRDSVNAVNRARARIQDSLRVVARRDSVRAAKPPLVLDPRPPVGGKPVGTKPVSGKAVSGKPVSGKPVAGKPVAAPPAVVVVDATPGRSEAPEPAPPEPTTPCECRVRGTIEVKSDKSLASPLSIVVGIKGQTTMKATVQLFMGSPRGFVFTHVPCGAIQLEIKIPEGRRFAIADAQTLGPYTCTRSGQWQPRLVLSPN